MEIYHLNISPGIYKFAVAWAKTNFEHRHLEKSWQPQLFQSFSNEFLVGDIGLNVDGTQRGGIIQ